MKELSTSTKSRAPLSEQERRLANAHRMRSYRRRTRGQVESRVTDRMIVEALALHLERVDRKDAKALLLALQPLVVDGLLHRGHDLSEAKAAFDRRLRGLVDPEAVGETGFVRRAAKERASGREPGGFFKRTQ